MSGITFRYPGGGRVLDDVSVDWPSTGVVALLGPNGAGKSTLMGLLVGVLKLQAGRIEMPTTSIGYVAQKATWPGRFTIRELLEYAAWWQRVPRAERISRVAAASEVLDLGKVLDQRLGQLSGGYHRRAMIAQGLVHDPGILVLDEPSVGLDPRQRVGLREQAARLARDRLVIVATHLVDDVEKIADWVTVLDEGEVTFTGAMTEIDRRYADRPSSGLEALYLDSTAAI